MISQENYPNIEVNFLELQSTGHLLISYAEHFSVLAQ